MVCGSSGWATPGTTTIPAGQYLKHPTTYIGLARLGSMVIDVSSNRLDAKFLRETGQVDDYFTILKGEGSDALRFATFRVQDGVITAQLRTVAGRVYQIQRASQLLVPDWQAVGTDITATSNFTSWTSTVPPDATESYYRAIQVTP